MSMPEAVFHQPRAVPLPRRLVTHLAVGVARRLPPFAAHAWVEADGVMVGEDYPPDYFRILLTVP